ncbi:hypothetical protein Syun_011514 [Stephania yunnanensis]|uniref:Pectinesterase inhibitor domain-containing protein n=1 Tax=Stephania yunnanensis TaxID=152371 RepID=A0AAP0JYE5_9MAGN
MDSINALKGYNKVGEGNLDNNNNPSLRKARKRLIISITSLVVLTILIIASIIGYASLSDESEDTRENENPNSASASTWSSDQILKSLCNATQHPNSCLSSLANSHASDPVELFKLSLKVSLEELSNVSSVPKRMMGRVNGGKGVETALRDCEGLIGDAIDGVNKSIECFTCLDGLEEVGSGGVVGDEMKVAMKDSVEFVSNSLAIVTRIVEMGGSGTSLSVPPHRKLLGISVKC